MRFGPSKKETSFFTGFVILWLIGFAMSLSLTGFIIWAIYRLVMHFTGG